MADTTTIPLTLEERLPLSEILTVEAAGRLSSVSWRKARTDSYREAQKEKVKDHLLCSKAASLWRKVFAGLFIMLKF